MIFLTDIDNNIRVATSNTIDTISTTILVSGSALTGASGRVSSGYYYFYGIHETIRAYMELNNLTLLTITVTYDASKNSTPVSVESKSLTILYKAVSFRAATGLTADIAATNRFLTPQKYGVLFNGGTISIPTYFESAENFYTVNYTNRNGQTGSYVARKLGSGVSSIDFNYSTQYSQVQVVLGNRSFTIYYIDILATEHFQYRNAFNALEKISIPASITSSPKTEFETARQGNITKRYDVEQELEMTIKSASLPDSLYPALLAMCRSRAVFRNEIYTVGNATYSLTKEVIIKEYKLEKSTNPNSELSLEMKFEYADRRDNDAVVLQ